MKQFWRNYNLSIVLATLFLTSWRIQTWTGWRQFSAEQQQHNQPAEVFGQDGYIWHWSEATFENWQSEFLQLITFVVLTTYLIHKGSHESKDTGDQQQQQLDRIEQPLAALAAGQGAEPSRQHTVDSVAADTYVPWCLPVAPLASVARRRLAARTTHRTGCHTPQRKQLLA